MKMENSEHVSAYCVKTNKEINIAKDSPAVDLTYVCSNYPSCPYQDECIGKPHGKGKNKFWKINWL